MIISLSLNGDDTLYFKQEMMLIDFPHSIKIFNVVSNDLVRGIPGSNFQTTQQHEMLFFY